MFPKVQVKWRTRNQNGSWTEHEAIGKFHQWGMELWEQEGPSVTYSVALVELEDGQIVEIMPNDVKFLRDE